MLSGDGLGFTVKEGSIALRRRGLAATPAPRRLRAPDASPVGSCARPVADDLLLPSDDLLIASLLGRTHDGGLMTS